ncbi:MAG TPA: type 2 lanthipeptide synthetase LanM family protein [Candidatus Dormibacteraeota bacterium]|nr:type 2 lanthipeptide synthetase LanM family protein [Candidatus Dormibacteraeota bacterium]
MGASILDDGSWRRAWSLTERLYRFRHAENKTQVAIDRELAAETLALWRASSPFDKDSYFTDRLAMEGISEDEFTRLLGTPVEAFGGNGTTPQWVQMLARAYSSPAALVNGDRGNWGEVAHHPEAAFLKLVEPLMMDARLQLQARVERIKHGHPVAPFAPESAVNALFVNLPARLLMIIAKTMVLELHVARLEGELEGATPAERFANFTERLSRSDIAQKLLSEYPVLARRLATSIENWVSYSAEVLERLAADWNEIVNLFNIGPECGLLVEASAGAGDTHRRGRSVLIARFESGLQLVYKPRSIAVDEHFQDFIRWVNRKGAYPQLRTVRVLKREEYGWVEFVNTASCRSHEEVVRFYERQGEYLAILYVLQATDFHFENLLACGEHPVLVDLEALFHPWLREIDVKQPDIRFVALAKSRSVLRAGLLPRRTGAHGDYIGMELSGLGGAPGQVTENILQWAGEGTDEMAAVKQPFRMPGARNRPSIDGVEIDVRAYVAQIVAGFTKMYDLLRAHRNELLCDDGPLSCFAENEVRVVARATRGYGVLLSQTLHPDYLRDALDLDRLLDRLWVGVESNSYLLRLITAERRDLSEGDVPIFTTCPASNDLFTSNGEKLEKVFAKTGMALSRECIEGLSAEDCRRQVWFIRASLATLDLQEDNLTRAGYEPVSPSSILSRKELAPLLIEEACRIGARLEELSLQDENHATWIGFSYVKKSWSLDALFEDLYAGSSGIILSLAYLGSFGFDRYTKLARRALNTLRARLEDSGKNLRSIGAFDGWGGIIYMVCHLAALWQDEELISFANSMVEDLPELIDKDESLDVIGGCAGCIGALLALHEISPSEKVLAMAVKCGDRLVARAQKVEGGLGWFTNVETVKPITGFAHGAAGIAWALLELDARTGNSNYRETALEAIMYEHGQFSPEAGNWAENAPGSELAGKETGPSMAWCYGAPGIGLARVAAMKHIDHPIVREDLQCAIRATISYGPGANHSLCHGDLGNLDFLLQASQATGGQELVLKVDELTNQVIASMKKYGWLCGVPLSVESPALMNGLAGICYGLLRMAQPDRVPSILILGPPLS